VLIHGLPSLYATRLAEHVLAEDPRTFVYATARPRDALAVDRALAAMEMEKEGARASRRTCVLEADPTAMDLGLSGAEFRMLAREVDRIHHATHESLSGLDAKEALAASVTCAAEILELARASTSLACLVFHSTTRVSGDRTGVVREEELDTRASFSDEEAQARMQAEALARRAAKDLPIVVVRPPWVVGAQSPRAPLDALHAATLVALGSEGGGEALLPRGGDTPVHAAPMEYVARAARALGQRRAALGGTFHLVDPHPLSARRFFQVLARAARGSSLLGSSGSMPRGARAHERFAQRPRSLFATITGAVRYDARGSTSALAGTGIACPPFEAYADTLVMAVEGWARARRDERPSARRAPDAEVYDPFA